MQGTYKKKYPSQRAQSERSCFVLTAQITNIFNKWVKWVTDHQNCLFRLIVCQPDLVPQWWNSQSSEAEQWFSPQTSSRLSRLFLSETFNTVIFVRQHWPPLKMTNSAGSRLYQLWLINIHGSWSFGWSSALSHQSRISSGRHTFVVYQSSSWI